MLQSVAISLVILWLDGASGQERVEQSSPSLDIQEGESITLTCNYSVGTFNGLVWYRQNPEEGPAFLFSLFSDREEKRKGRVKATLEKTNSHSSLRIIASQPRDSATYLCAVLSGGAGTKLTFGKGTQLKVKPNIQNPQPALYQLRSPKSSNTSVCLLTDFGFYNGSIKNETVTGSEATVLEMMTMESKSYGAVTWGSKSTSHAQMHSGKTCSILINSQVPSATVHMQSKALKQTEI